MQSTIYHLPFTIYFITHSDTSSWKGLYYNVAFWVQALLYINSYIDLGQSLWGINNTLWMCLYCCMDTGFKFILTNISIDAHPYLNDTGLKGQNPFFRIPPIASKLQV